MVESQFQPSEPIKVRVKWRGESPLRRDSTVSKRHLQEVVSFVDFLASILVNQLKQNQKIANGIKIDSWPIDPDRKVDNSIYRSAQIQSLVRELYYDSNDPFNLKVLASLQKLVPEQLHQLLEGEALVEEQFIFTFIEEEASTFLEEEASTFLEDEELTVPFIDDGIDDDDIPF